MAVGYIDAQGKNQPVTIPPDLYSLASKAGLTVPAYLNREYPDAKASEGTAAQQIFATAGLVVPDHKDNPLMLRPCSVADILEGRSELMAGPANVKDSGSPFGSASRILFPAAVIASVESAMNSNWGEDEVSFNQMVANTINIAGENFEQPVINYQGQGGPMSAKAQRVAQLSLPPALLKITTSDRPRRLASHAIGMEMSEQALRATTLDLVSMTMTRFLKVEMDARVYAYIADLFVGNQDLITGAISSVASSTLDAASTGGVLTHRAWVKFLARSRRYRKITHLVCDIDTYLKIEGRIGRPGSNNYDPTLVRIDPQAEPMNVGFGNNVKYMIVDSAAEGGPVPANTIYAVDASQAITKVVNTAAAYTASEEFVMKRGTAMRIDWSEDVYRTWGDSELKAFDILTITP